MRSAKIVSRYGLSLANGTANGKQALPSMSTRRIVFDILSTTTCRVFTCNYCGLYVKFIWFY